MNDKLSRVLFLMLGVLMLVSCSHKDNSMFSGLDYQMSMSPTYDAKKLSQIESLKLISRDLDRNGQFRTLMRIGEEYESFQFDSSLTYFSAALQVARQTGGKDDIDLANIRLGRLYTRAGHFLEANTTLFERIDPSSLSPAIQGEYYAAVLKSAGDLTGNSGVYDYCELPDIDQARKDFYSSADPASLMYAEVKISEMLYGDRLLGADSLCRAILARIPDSDRDYAMFAWYQSQICEYLGQSQERMEWLVKSAEADMINSVKDYASLTLIAQSLMDIDMNRSFRYYVRSFNDATSYNAKLRPWQIAQSFNQIQQARDFAGGKPDNFLFM